MPGTLGLPAFGLVARAASLAALVAILLATLGPPGGDEPAHLYRAYLVRHDVFIWDNFWFGGHYPLASYSLLYYFPASVVGNVRLTVAAVVLSAALFAGVARHEWHREAYWPALTFAVVAAAPLFTGTYPFAVGVACLLGTLRALQLGRTWIAVLCTGLTVGFSPLAFFFLCLALLAAALVRGRLDRPVVILTAAAGLTGALQAAALAVFAHDATYPFFRVGELAAVLSASIIGTFLALQSPRSRILAAFLALWGIAALLAFLIPTPVGENVTRLRGFLFPLILLVVIVGRFRPLWLAVPALVPAFAYTTIPYLGVIPHRGDTRSASEGFWTPALDFLRAHESFDYRIEVVPTGDHWEAYWVPRAGFPLARGWYRQLDYAQNPLFYQQGLLPHTYLAWLRRMAVRYVLLPNTQIGRAGEEREADLLRSGASGLREVFRTSNWRIYAVPAPRPLLTGPATAVVTQLGHDFVAGEVGAVGTYRLALRFTPYWRLVSGALCSAEARDGMTDLRFSRPGSFRLQIALTARGSTVCRGDPSR
jgi:hypothetical protein